MQRMGTRAGAGDKSYLYEQSDETPTASVSTLNLCKHTPISLLLRIMVGQPGRPGSHRKYKIKKLVMQLFSDKFLNQQEQVQLPDSKDLPASLPHTDAELRKICQRTITYNNNNKELLHSLQNQVTGNQLVDLTRSPIMSKHGFCPCRAYNLLGKRTTKTDPFCKVGEFMTDICKSSHGGSGKDVLPS